LAGKVWVASFVFSRCCTDCPQVSAGMARLQGELAGQEGVVLVSFSVDPEYDTPERLQEYAARWGADGQRWLFLTGTEEVIYPLLEKSFHVGVQQNTGSARTQGNEVTHSSKLVVVDQRGRIRGYYSGIPADGADDIPRVKEKVLALLREQP
jgi:cytochrome oxidase Cu insertion factor (SCO1/SenC/PrrC family)